jgi:uncharacterized Tic20 family protein
LQKKARRRIQASINQGKIMSDNQTQTPPPLQPPPAAPATPPPSPESQARTWNMLCHLSALAGYIGIPFGNILGPLLVWQLKKNEFPSVDVHGKAALNFQITVVLAALVTGAVTFMGMIFCVGWLLLPVFVLIALAGLIFPIIAGVKANNGEDYKYPWSIEFVK